MPVKVDSVEYNLDIPWAAGLFDGEGSTSILKTKRDRYAYVRMNVPQKFREVLDKFITVIKVGKIYKHNKREMHSLDIYKQQDVVDALNILWPYLSEIKKKQALNAFTKMEEHNNYNSM